MSGDGGSAVIDRMATTGYVVLIAVTNERRNPYSTSPFLRTKFNLDFLLCIIKF
jgi:hypothetical protein